METKDADHKARVCCLQHTKDKFDGGFNLTFAS